MRRAIFTAVTFPIWAALLLVGLTAAWTSVFFDAICLACRDLLGRMSDVADKLDRVEKL